MLEWIVTSSLLILVVLVLRLLLRNRLSGRVRYALWAVVLLRLLIPVQLFTAPVSVGEYLSQPDAAAQEERTIYVLPVQEIPLEEAEEEGLIRVEGNQVVSDANSFGYARVEGDTVRRYAGKITPAALGMWVWGIGGALVLLALLWSNLHFARRLRRLRRPLKAENCLLPVYEAEGLPSPCLFGLFHPAVYVTPEATADPMVLRHVLAHETTHYRHGDHIWSALRAVALVLHWYNPLVWWAVIASKRDGELACDEGAIRILGEGERQAYGETLLHLLTVKPGPGDLLACATTMTGDKRSLRERITRISCKGKLFVGISAAVIIAVLLSCFFLFSRAEEQSGNTTIHLGLDRTTVEGTESGESVLELPSFLDTKEHVLLEFNQQMAQMKGEYEEWIHQDPANSCELYAYPSRGETCYSIVMWGNKWPSYGTDGEVRTFCYSWREERAITAEDALAASGWTEDAMHNALSDYIYTHFTDFGYPEDAASFEVNLEIAGFRQRQDGGWDFFLRYQKPEDIYSDAWSYLLTFSDGVIMKGIAIPEEEIEDIGCSLKGLVPYTTEGRSIVMTADQVMAGITEADLVYVDRDGLGDPAELAAALNRAADHVVQPLRSTDAVEASWWTFTIYLTDSLSNADPYLWIYCGLPENLVTVRYGDRPYYNTVQVEDETLYWLLRNACNSEGTVDQAAAERYAPQLNAHMEAMLQDLQEIDAERVNWTDTPGERANYTGYQLLNFQEAAVYDDILPGQVIHLYSFDYAVTMEHPENMYWVGGNSLDGKLRMRGMDNYTYFAAALDERGELTGTRFFDFGLFWGMDEAAGEQNARDTILYSFTHDEEA